MQRGRILWLLVPLFFSLGAFSPTRPAGSGAKPSSLTGPTSATDSVAADDLDGLLKQFETDIYPLLSRDEQGCFDCHSGGGDSELVFSGHPREDLAMLLDGGFLSADGPDTLLGRIDNENEIVRMPDGDDPWTADEIGLLKKFVAEVENLREPEVPLDEQFPRALLLPYRGTEPAGVDNQFLSYWQLKSKIQILFNDSWQRNGRDLFAENISLFGGADFETRFNESREPSAPFLTGLEMLAKDVSRRAFEQKSGPFQIGAVDWSTPLAPDSDMETLRQGIAQLYQKILFRTPTANEYDQAIKLLTHIGGLSQTIAQRDHSLEFELTVEDPTTGLAQLKHVQLPVNGRALPVHQQWVDQTVAAEAVDGVSKIQIGPPIELGPDCGGRMLVIHNVGTYRNVSFAGVEFVKAEPEDAEGAADDSATALLRPTALHRPIAPSLRTSARIQIGLSSKVLGRSHANSSTSAWRT